VPKALKIHALELVRIILSCLRGRENKPYNKKRYAAYNAVRSAFLRLLPVFGHGIQRINLRAKDENSYLEIAKIPIQIFIKGIWH
jgi:hypothetical protein